MFSCPSCLHSVVKAVSAEATGPARRLATTRALPSHGSTTVRQSYATAARAPRRISERIAEENEETVGHDMRGTAARRHARMELQHINEPLKLATQTLRLLEKNDAEQAVKAAEMVRMASRAMACTVSWNHLINDEMNKGRVAPAMKLYNEMKKRGQKPDAYTFTIVLRGLAANAHVPTALEKALSVYHSMFADNSPTKPNLLHTNAVLNVCAKAGDVDALFGIAAKLPTTGRGAPDHFTFTTILNAIHHASVVNDRFDPDELAHVRSERHQGTLIQGRRIWGDIVSRWKEGSLAMDEGLVAAMARLLLLGEQQKDYDDVLSLVEQTMNIPRQLPSLGDRARGTHLRQVKWAKPTEAAVETTATTDVPATNADNYLRRLDEASYAIEDDNNAANDSDGMVSQDSVPDKNAASSEFAPLGPSKKPRRYVRPGSNVLSVLLEACQEMNALTTGSAYWKIFCEQLDPDMENCHQYLRLLRIQRASRASIEVVRAMSMSIKDGGLGTGVVGATFKIASAACKRDSKNPNSTSHIVELLKLMSENLENPEPRVVTALSELVKSRIEGTEIAAVLRVLEPLYDLSQNLCSLVNYGNFANSGSMRSIRHDKRNTPSRLETFEAVQSVVGSYHKALDYHGQNMNAEKRNLCASRRMILNSWTVRWTKKIHEGVPAPREYRAGFQRQPAGRFSERGIIQKTMS